MKNLLFCLIGLIAVVFFSACAADGGCSFEGKWKVKIADIQSEKFSPSVIELAKSELMNTQYEFTDEGAITLSYSDQRPPNTGTYSFDSSSQTIEWSAGQGETKDLIETSKVTSCSGNEIMLSQRIPADPAKEELAIITFTLEKM